MSAEAVLLGCGTSTGVPVIGCHCAVCTSASPRNRRLRPSLLLRLDGRVFVVDTTPDFRQQALAAGLERLDGLLFTHAHADHIYGLDDVRVFNFRQGGSIPCFGSPETLERLERSFAYIFDGQPAEGGGKPHLALQPIDGPFHLPGTGHRVIPVPVEHGTMEVLGFRLGSFAYVTDCHRIPEASHALLAGVEVLVLDALRYRPHATHLSVAEAVEEAARIGARRTVLTHLSHDVDYERPELALPPGVELGHDGLELVFEPEP